MKKQKNDREKTVSEGDGKPPVRRIMGRIVNLGKIAVCQAANKSGDRKNVKKDQNSSLRVICSHYHCV